MLSRSKQSQALSKPTHIAESAGSSCLCDAVFVSAASQVLLEILLLDQFLRILGQVVEEREPAYHEYHLYHHDWRL